MIKLDSIIYAIIRNPNNMLELKVFPVELQKEPSDGELCEGHDYAISLSSAYCSYLPKIPEDKLSVYTNRKERREAIAHKQTRDRINKRYDVVAISHRLGGWTSFEWEYNPDITFEICSNFGYGWSSYFHTRFYYKGIQLTPYSEYIRYRYAGYATIMRYTYTYSLVYSQWKKLMEDTLTFYNAVYRNQEHQIFKWIKSHLTEMINGLERLLYHSVFYFYDNDSQKYKVEGNDLIFIKAEKISGAIDFISNIKELPTQVSPHEYISCLENIFNSFIMYAAREENKFKNEIQNKHSRISDINSEWGVLAYDRLYKKHWYKDAWIKWTENKQVKRKMIRHLFELKHRLGIHIRNCECIDQIKKIETLRKERETLKSEIYEGERIIKCLGEAVDKIKIYQKEGL